MREYNRNQESVSFHVGFDFGVGNFDIIGPRVEILGRSTMMAGMRVEQVEVPIKRIFPDDLKSHFVQSVACQFTPESFILTLFEVWPPVVFGPTGLNKEDDIKKLKEKEVDAKCVARVVMTPQFMRQLVKAVTESLENFDKSFGKEVQQK